MHGVVKGPSKAVPDDLLKDRLRGVMVVFTPFLGVTGRRLDTEACFRGDLLNPAFFGMCSSKVRFLFALLVVFAFVCFSMGLLRHLF